MAGKITRREFMRDTAAAAVAAGFAAARPAAGDD